MKNIVAYDVETTGLNKKEDFIIQLSAIKFSPDWEILGEKNWYVLPIHKFVISEGAFKAHGITEEFLKEHGQSMSVVGPEFNEFCKGCDLLTYNGNHFDIHFIIKDLAMVGVKFDISDRTLYDSYSIECLLNPRTLGAVYKKRCGDDLEGAHNSMNDVRATIDVFKSQVSEMGLPLEDVARLDECNVFCLEGSLRLANNKNEEDRVVFNVGKYKDSEFIHVMKTDLDYIKWFVTTLGEPTRKHLVDYIKKYKDIYQ